MVCNTRKGAFSVTLHQNIRNSRTRIPVLVLGQSQFLFYCLDYIVPGSHCGLDNHADTADNVLIRLPVF